MEVMAPGKEMAASLRVAFCKVTDERHVLHVTRAVGLTDSVECLDLTFPPETP